MCVLSNVYTAHSVEKVSRRGQKVLERLVMCALSRPSHICRFRQVVSYNFEISILSTNSLTCLLPFPAKIMRVCYSGRVPYVHLLSLLEYIYMKLL